MGCLGAFWKCAWRSGISSPSIRRFRNARCLPFLPGGTWPRLLWFRWRILEFQFRFRLTRHHHHRALSAARRNEDDPFDSVVFDVQQTDHSYGRSSADAEVWMITNPTPGLAN